MSAESNDGLDSNRNRPLAGGPRATRHWLGTVEANWSTEATQWHADTPRRIARSRRCGGRSRTARFELTPGGVRRDVRRSLGAMVPTVLVQEGGYVLDTLGDLVLAALRGLAV